MLVDAQARLREAQLSIENTIRANANAVQAHAEAVGIFRNSLIPQRETVLARSQQEQNFMLIGVFELIQAKAKEYDAYQGYLEAVRDYWQARVELTRSVGGRLPSDAGKKENTPSVEDILTPKGGMEGMDHSSHDMSNMKTDETSGKAGTESEPDEEKKLNENTPEQHQHNGAHS